MSKSAFENDSPIFEVTELFQRVETFGIRLSDPARVLVLEELSMAVKLGTIETPEHQVQGAAALIAAGARVAGWSEAGESVYVVGETSGQPQSEEIQPEGSLVSTSGTIVLEPSHIREGWMTLAGGNHPAHRCLRRTVLEQVPEVEAALPLFGVLRREI